jgi:large subunit ribosomal protein L41
MNPFKIVKGLFNYASEVSRKRKALSFRKTLGVYNYKVNKNTHYKNPHGIPFKLREDLYNNKNGINQRKLYFLKRNSNKPYGALSKQGHFVMDYRKLPVYDIPATQYFYLKPFINKKAPNMSAKTAEEKSNKFNYDILDKIRTQLLLTDDKQVRRIGLELFETDFGKQVLEEFLDSQKRNYFLDEKNPKFTQNRKKIREKITLRDLKNDTPYNEIKIFENYPTVQKYIDKEYNEDIELEFRSKRYKKAYRQELEYVEEEEHDTENLSKKPDGVKRRKVLAKKNIKSIEYSPVDKSGETKLSENANLKI